MKIIDGIEKMNALHAQEVKEAIIVYPTDTVWGIGAWVGNSKAHKLIAQIKNTAQDKPLSILLGDVNQVLDLALWPEFFSKKWASDFFALQTSLLIKRDLLKTPISDDVLSNGPWVSIRCLENPMIKTLVSKMQGPLSSTSLNVTGRPPITSLEAAMKFCQDEVAPKSPCYFIQSIEKELSGKSSSMLFYGQEQGWQWGRKGLEVDKIEKLVKKIGGKIF